MGPSERISDLYCRYNGSLMGAFMADAHCRAEMPQYPAVRRRLQTLLEELHIDLALPDSHAEYKQRHFCLVEAVLEGLAPVSRELGSFYELGAMITLLFMADEFGRDATALESAVAGRLEQAGLSPDWLPDTRLRAKTMGERAFAGAAPVLSGAYAFADFAIRGLAPEADTAFVAMPFKEPFESHFGHLYRPLLESIGCRVVRAWCGVDVEAYQPLMLTLIDKSGVLLADVTGGNANVVHEFGVFSGAVDRFRFSYLLADRTFDITQLPSNIGHRQILQYDTDRPGWPWSEVQRLSGFLQDAEPMVAMCRARRDRERGTPGLGVEVSE